MKHTLLSNEELSSNVVTVLDGAPTKMMAAKGISPLSDPKDVLTVLYQIALDNDEKLKTSAISTMEKLPPNILDAGLSDPQIHPLVIDRYIAIYDSNVSLVQKIILNPATGHETISALANTASSAACDLIASNEERLLKHPSIIASLYSNTNARMSTVDKTVELAIRNEIEVNGIPAWEELKKTFLDTEQDPIGNVLDEKFKDELFERARLESEKKKESRKKETKETEPEEEAPISIRDMTIPMKIRLAILGNSFDRGVLIQDAKKLVAMAAIKSPAVSDTEAAKYATNQSICEDVIAYISTRRDWVKQYGTKLSLVNNPKTPIAISMNLMKHLRTKDIRMISRSKGIPSALATQARRLVQAKSGGNKK